MNRKSLLSALIIAVACVSPALAADTHKHDAPPPHGGQYVEIGAVGLELVAKADSLTLYLSDNDKPAASAGGKGKATVFAGNDKIEVAFEPAGDNKMIAKGNFKVGVGVRVAVAVALPGKPETKATFRLK